jgi:molybdopterin adenylyltransferase
METAGILQIRVLSLGDAGGRALPAVVREVRARWSAQGGLAIESARGGDDARGAAAAMRRWADRDQVDVVLTVGRGGPTREDFAPEITAALLDRALPGVEERMCLATPRRPEDLLFRGRAGLRRATLVVNLPERPARARLIVGLLGPVVRHALEKARGSDRECAPAKAGR